MTYELLTYFCYWLTNDFAHNLWKIIGTIWFTLLYNRWYKTQPFTCVVIDGRSLFRSKRIVLIEMFQTNTSKFAAFFCTAMKSLFVCFIFHFMQLYFFPCDLSRRRLEHSQGLARGEESCTKWKMTKNYKGIHIST